jgi:hypothetical protein
MAKTHKEFARIARKSPQTQEVEQTPLSVFVYG